MMNSAIYDSLPALSNLFRWYLFCAAWAAIITAYVHGFAIIEQRGAL